MITTNVLERVINEFNIDASLLKFSPITHGYINDTYLASLKDEPKFIVQRLNHLVFENYETLQRNIDLATSKLIHKDYAQISFLKTRDNASLLQLDGTIWRVMNYIPNSRTFNTTSDATIAFEAGKIVGLFHSLLTDEDLALYDDVIPQFHDLPMRIGQFNQAFKIADNIDIATAQSEIDFANAVWPIFKEIYSVNIPLRICHNDTKLNNILFDTNKKALCLIDLDTIMKGWFMFDFGDAIRTIVNAASEDEKNLDKIQFDLSQFRAFVSGLKASELKLSELELKYLAHGAALMPFIHGLRALTDYLNKNKYYKVSYPEQNLDRAKSLFRSSQLALDHLEDMQTIIQDIYS